MMGLERSAQSAFVTSPFADAVLTPSFAVSATGPHGDKAEAHDRTALPVKARPRPVVEIGRRLPLLTGRSVDLDDLSEQIRKGESVEIFGGEGYGKTSLLNLLLHDRQDLKGYFADGVVALSGRRIASGDLVGSLFRTFFTADAVVALDETEMLRWLSPIRALIVLDDINTDGPEFQAVIASLTSPVFVVTSTQRRLHDLTGRAVGPLATDDFIAIAELRLGGELGEDDRQRVLQLAQLLDGRPRSWARALGLVADLGDLGALVTRLDAARSPQAETARLALDRTGPAALKVVTILAELSGTAVGDDLIGTLAGVEDVGALAAELEQRGVGIVVDGRLAVDADIVAAVSQGIDGDRVVGEAFDRLLAWSDYAEPTQVADEAAAVTALADWALVHDRPEDVVELGRRVDDKLFRTGRWGAAAGLLHLVSRAGEMCGRPSDAAWALHQIGVRELALGNLKAAKPHLKAARSMRRKLGEKAAEALTKHHLGLLGPLAAISVPLVAAVVVGLLATASVATASVLALTGGDEVGDPAGPETSTPQTIVSPEGLTLGARLDGAVSVVVTFVLEGGLQPEELVQVSRTAPDDSELILVEAAELTSVVDRGLEEETTYSYRARIVAGERSGPWSDPVMITTQKLDDREAPDAPSGLTAELSQGVVELNWRPSAADDVAGYEVLRDGAPVAQDLDGVLFMDEQPRSGSTHGYQVIAFDESGNLSAPSNEVEVRIPGVPPAPVAAPTNLVWAFDPAVGATVSWTGTVTSYRVQREDWPRVRIVGRPRLVDTDVVDGQPVTYQVWATEDGRSSAAKSISFVAKAFTSPLPRPSAPGSPSATVTGSAVSLRWPAISYSFPITYQVRRDGVVVTDNVGGTSYDDPLPADGTYAYTVMAVNSDGVASLSSPAVQVIVAAAPPGRGLVVAPSRIDLGTIDLDDQVGRQVQVTNDSADPIDLGSLTISGGRFTVTADAAACEPRIAPQATCSIVLDFRADAVGNSGTGDVSSSTEGTLLTWSGAVAAPAVTFELGLDVTGSGTVSSSPAGITCGSNCLALFVEGTQVTLTATPTGGSVFGGWAAPGTTCSGAPTCTVTMSGSRDVTAFFAPAPPPPQPDKVLEVTINGDGTGTVTSNPGGIGCSATCSAPFAHDMVVTLTGAPGSLQIFQGWSGGGCSGTGTCTVTMDQARFVRATFDTTF